MKNVLILTYWSYPDALIQTYTLPYVRIIRKIIPEGSSLYLITLEKDVHILEQSKRDSITAQLAQEGIRWLPFEYTPFGIVAFFSWIRISLKLSWIIIKKNISFIHCWCTPAGAIGYFLSLVLHRKLVLDSFEPHAETMVENGTWKRTSFAFRILFWLEKKQASRASYIISATEGMREYAEQKYGVIIDNFMVKPACVDLELFSPETNDQQLRHILGLENKVVCVYAGKFGGIYLEDEIFDFVKVAADYWGDAFRFLILTNHTHEEIATYRRRAGLRKDQVIDKFVPHHEVPRYMGLANFGLTPVKPIPTKRYCTPIKDGEYWALGLPVVISSNISDDSEIIESNNIGVVLKSFDKIAYSHAVIYLDEILKTPGLRVKIRNIAKQYRSFGIAQNVYNQIYSASQ